MTVLLDKIDRYFWLFLLLGVICGFLFPATLEAYQGWVVYIIMGIMGLLFLKVDIVDIVTHVKNPLFLLYVSIVNLIITPVLTFLVFKNMDPSLGMGILLLAALPTGVSSAAFTDIMEGKTPLSVTIIIVTNLLATLTIPFLFWFLYKTDIQLDYLGLFTSMLKIILIPFIIAKLLKRVFLKKKVVEKIQDYNNILILILVMFMMMIAIAVQSEYILDSYQEHLRTIGILFLVFPAFQFLAYFSVFWRKKGGKIAVSNSNMIMNNILGIVLSIAFFPPEVLTTVILSFIPWTVMIVAKHWYKKYLP